MRYDLCDDVTSLLLRTPGYAKNDDHVLILLLHSIVPMMMIVYIQYIQYIWY